MEHSRQALPTQDSSDYSEVLSGGIAQKPPGSKSVYQHIRHAKDLEALCEELRELPELAAKRAIQHAAVAYDTNDTNSTADLENRYAQPGDDCAAFRAGDGYQLLAMEGMLPDFVKNDPRAAAWSSVMVNVSDIAAMGGRPLAIANAFWHNNDSESQELLFHMRRACSVFGVQFSGGHSSISPAFTPGLAVAITGYANNLLSCYHVKPGQRLFILSDLTGSWHGDLPYWGCVEGKSHKEIRQQWQLPADLADRGLVAAAKDISNGGILGTLIMMLELTGCGASIDLNAIPKPATTIPDHPDYLRWLRAFQSFGFLLAVDNHKIGELLKFFNNSHLTCAPIGDITANGKIQVNVARNTADFWDIRQEPLTGMGVHNHLPKTEAETEIEKKAKKATSSTESNNIENNNSAQGDKHARP